jgi:aminoglycoside 3-N-acetyltransferase
MKTEEETGYLKIASSLGLKEDDVVFIASDLTRLAFNCMEKGEVFDVDKFIDSFIAQVPNGSVVIPTFTDNLTQGVTFDVQKSKPNIGALPTAAFKRKEAYRTIDPFHSMAVWGRHVPLFKSSIENSTFGANSGFGLLHQLKAKMILIDVTIKQAFTYVHYCEEHEQAPWRKFVNHQMHIIDHQGAESLQEFRFYTRKPGIINAFYPLEAIFLKENILQIVEIDEIPIGIIDLSKAFDRILQDINENKGRNLHQFSFYEWLRVMAKKILKR